MYRIAASAAALAIVAGCKTTAQLLAPYADAPTDCAEIAAEIRYLAERAAGLGCPPLVIDL